MKQIIWSSDALLDETAREYYQNFKREELDDDAYKVSDEEWSDEVYNELGDERQNLNKDVNGVIIAFGDLGLWNGRKQGYQILGDNIAGILQSTQYDAEWYGDGYDIRGRMSHHVPCAIGFGISTPEQAKKMADISDGAIVGSAIIKLLEKHGKEAPDYIGEYVRSMKNAIR